jgi:hypothetical protein
MPENCWKNMLARDSRNGCNPNKKYNILTAKSEHSRFKSCGT